MNKSWSQIDQGLKSLMANNDSFSDDDLRLKSKRLKHLSLFAELLRKRVNERINGVLVGPIEPLFDEYKKARLAIDNN